MRLVKLLAALFPKFYASLHQILSMEEKDLEPKDFLQEVLRKAPDELYVKVVGPSMIAVFKFAHNGVVYSTLFYTEDNLMPAIYRALLHAAVDSSPRGRVPHPLQVIVTYRVSVAHYLGAERMQAAFHHRWTEHVDAKA